MADVASDREQFTLLRREATLRTARETGLLGGQTRRIGGRLEETLVSAAKARSASRRTLSFWRMLWREWR